jgi:catechol-2,3-dioxygenase
VAVVIGCQIPQPIEPPPAKLAVDHLPVAVRSLAAAEQTYRDALGFRLKAGRTHENG